MNNDLDEQEGQRKDLQVEDRPPAEQAWREFRNLMTEHDKRLVEDWNDEIAGLLILAGLFSAVVTAFTIESYQKLQQDPEDSTVALLSQLVHLMNSSAPHTQTSPVFHAPISAVRLNALWFLSLAMSLVVALLGLVVKQWLREYTRSVNSSDVRMQVRVRQLKYDGLIHWRVPEIMAVLPLILQAAVILFLIGLMVFLRELHIVVAAPMIAFSALFLAAFGLSLFMPSRSLSCPYRSPLAWLYVRFLPSLSPFNEINKAESWINRDVSALETNGPFLDVHSLDRRALTWTYRNSQETTRTLPILSCAMTTSPLAIFDLLALHHGLSLVDLKNCVSSFGPNDDWGQLQHKLNPRRDGFIPILRTMLEALSHYNPRWWDGLTRTDLAVLILALASKEISIVPDEIVSAYLKMVLYIVRYQYPLDDHDYIRLSYSVGVVVQLYITEERKFSYEQLDALIRWANYASQPSRFIGGPEDGVSSSHSQPEKAFENAATAVFQALGHSQNLTVSEREQLRSRTVPLLANFSQYLKQAERQKSYDQWLLLDSLISGGVCSPDLFPSREVTSVLDLITETGTESWASYAGYITFEYLAGWAVFCGLNLNLYLSEVIPPSRDERWADYLDYFDRVCTTCGPWTLEAEHAFEQSVQALVRLIESAPKTRHNSKARILIMLLNAQVDLALRKVVPYISDDSRNSITYSAENSGYRRACEQHRRSSTFEESSLLAVQADLLLEWIKEVHERDSQHQEDEDGDLVNERCNADSDNSSHRFAHSTHPTTTPTIGISFPQPLLGIITATASGSNSTLAANGFPLPSLTASQHDSAMPEPDVVVIDRHSLRPSPRSHRNIAPVQTGDVEAIHVGSSETQHGDATHLQTSSQQLPPGPAASDPSNSRTQSSLSTSGVSGDPGRDIELQNLDVVDNVNPAQVQSGPGTSSSRGTRRSGGSSWWHASKFRGRLKGLTANPPSPSSD